MGKGAAKPRSQAHPARRLLLAAILLLATTVLAAFSAGTRRATRPVGARPNAPLAVTGRSAFAKQMPLEEAQARLTFPQYKDWRNYERLKNEIKNLYELIQTGKRSYFE
jgi:hypothetical protein